MILRWAASSLETYSWTEIFNTLQPHNDRCSMCMAFIWSKGDKLLLLHVITLQKCDVCVSAAACGASGNTSMLFVMFYTLLSQEQRMMSGMMIGMTWSPVEVTLSQNLGTVERYSEEELMHLQWKSPSTSKARGGDAHRLLTAGVCCKLCQWF